jgi:hypothetical protein
VKRIKKRTGTLVMICVVAMAFSSCSKKPDNTPLPDSNSNYIKKENTYYKLDAAVAMYDSIAPDRIVFRLLFTAMEPTRTL